MDIVQLLLDSAFLRFWTRIIKTVDTPSIAAARTPADSPGWSEASFLTIFFFQMDFEDWDLITDDSQEYNQTNHTRAPIQVSSLSTTSTTTIGTLMAAPKSQPLQRPEQRHRPRIKAPLQVKPEGIMDQHGRSLNSTFCDVSQLQRATPLQRPPLHLEPVTSAPITPSDSPLPAPQLRSGYRHSTGPQMRLTALSNDVVVSPMPSDTTKLPSRSTRKLPLNPKGMKKQRPPPVSRMNSCSTCPAVQAIWPQFVTAFLSFSPMLQNLSASANFDEHCQRILDSFAASTIYRYLSTLMQFYAACCSLRVSLEGMTEIQFADILLAGRSSEPRVSPSMCIKSVRWAFKQFGIQCFQMALGPLISSFTKEHVISDRREALPYSLLVIIQWERRLLQSSATQQEILGLGSFLLMLWSGMRFADLQRTYLSSLAYDMSSLRGLSYKTKTCKSGCPFGLVCRGFLSSGSFTWVHRYLQELDSLYATGGKQPNEVDFIIPSLDQLSADGGPCPMTYPEALHYCRYFLSLPWRKSPLDTALTAQHYTVHGLKSTLLSFANQLQLAPELRRLQGKHKDPLQSTRLYSRDDVSGALQLQNAIIDSVQKGWRPHTPLGRGGQTPIPEQSFTLEKFKKDVVDPQPQWSFFSFNQQPQFEAEIFESGDVEGSSESSSSTDSSESSSSPAARGNTSTAREPRTVPDSFDEISMGVFRQTWHVVMNPHPEEGVPPEGQWITACGRRFHPESFSIREALALEPGHVLCAHPGCKKGWISVGIFK